MDPSYLSAALVWPSRVSCGDVLTLLYVLHSHVDGFWTGPVDILKWNNEGIHARNASVPGYEWEQCLAVRLDERVPAKDRVGFSEHVRKNSLNVDAVVGLLYLAVTVWWRLGLEKCSVLLQETCMSFWTLDLHIGQSQRYPQSCSAGYFFSWTEPGFWDSDILTVRVRNSYHIRLSAWPRLAYCGVKMSTSDAILCM